MITKKELLDTGFNRDSILEQKENKSGDFVEMVSILLHSRTQTHTLHLQTNN